MTVNLYNNYSDNSVMGKTITLIKASEFTAKDDVSIEEPVIVLKYSDDIKDTNYCYIEKFKRFYYVRSKTVLTGGRLELELKCDVLETYKEKIKLCPAILAFSEKTGASNYMPAEGFVRNVKMKTDIKQFPSGLSDNGTYILITSGG